MPGSPVFGVRSLARALLKNEATALRLRRPARDRVLREVHWVRSALFQHPALSSALLESHRLEVLVLKPRVARQFDVLDGGRGPGCLEPLARIDEGEPRPIAC